MWKYVLKRILQLIPSFIIVSFVVYWLTSLGDPAAVIGGIDATEEQLDAIREALGFNRPLIVRYLDYMFHLVQGDMGNDIYGNPVWTQFAERFPYTWLIMLSSVVLATSISIPAGIRAALHKDTWRDTMVTIGTLFFNCMPLFWLGMILQNIFAVNLKWLPTSGIRQGVFIGMILPLTASLVRGLAGRTRQTRSAILDSLNADYVRTALAKGVRYKKAVYEHALPNALLPIITNIGAAFTMGLNGAVALEMVFGWPGLGTLLIPAIRSFNFPVTCGVVMMSTFMIGFINLLIDITYAFVDPRVKARYASKRGR